jgi:hypothetical protein
MTGVRVAGGTGAGVAVGIGVGIAVDLGVGLGKGVGVGVDSMICVGVGDGTDVAEVVDEPQETSVQVTRMRPKTATNVLVCMRLCDHERWVTIPSKLKYHICVLPGKKTISACSEN